MSMWQDIFDIYQSVQSGEEERPQQVAKKSEGPKADEQRTLYVFAYLDDGTGKTVRSMPVEDRLTMGEAKQKMLETRIAELEAALQEALEEVQDSDDDE
jgi:hypothetical protein